MLHKLVCNLKTQAQEREFKSTRTSSENPTVGPVGGILGSLGELEARNAEIWGHMVLHIPGAERARTCNRLESVFADTSTDTDADFSATKG